MGVTYKERTGQNRSLWGQPRVLQPVPNQLHQGTVACPIARFRHPRELWPGKKGGIKETFRRFGAQWNAKRDDLKRRRDWLSYQIGHSTGTAQEKLKAEMEQVKGSIDQFDGQRRNAPEVVRQSWEGPGAGQ